MRVLNKKSKGSNAERELVRLFWGSGWAAIRVAGSGATSFPNPDVLAGSAGKGRTLAVECKSTAELSKTLSKGDISQLKSFADSFGAESWIGIRFDEKRWRFVSLEELAANNKQTISLNFADKNGLTFNELIGNF